MKLTSSGSSFDWTSGGSTRHCPHCTRTNTRSEASVRLLQHDHADICPYLIALDPAHWGSVDIGHFLCSKQAEQVLAVINTARKSGLVGSYAINLLFHSAFSEQTVDKNALRLAIAIAAKHLFE